MDVDVIAILDKAGTDTSLDGVLPRIRLQLNGSGRLEPLDSRITVEAGAAVAVVEVKTIPQLFARHVPLRQPPQEVVTHDQAVHRPPFRQVQQRTFEHGLTRRLYALATPICQPARAPRPRAVAKPG